MRQGKLIAALLISTSIPTLAAAQDVASEAVNLGTIVLEAERRTDSLADVPISVTVVDGRDIERGEIQDARDLADRVPNFTLQTNASRTNPQYFIRGIGAVSVVDPGAQQAVSTYVDGVYQPFSSGVIADFSDIDRIEVLRGPQGTLYGRNATSGSVNVFTRMPEPFTGGSVRLGYGSDNLRSLSATANLALPNDQGAVRLSFLNSARDGFVENALGAQWFSPSEVVLRYV